MALFASQSGTQETMAPFGYPPARMIWSIFEPSHVKIRQQVINRIGESIGSPILLVADNTIVLAPYQAKALNFIRRLTV